MNGRAFAEAWSDGTFVQQAAAQLPWFHLCMLLDKLKTNAEREWYAAKAVEHGWSRNILAMQIETRLHERQGSAVTNFRDRLASPQSDLAREALKDPYIFDFLGLTADAQERDIERALTQHITRFLIELSTGFVARALRKRRIHGLRRNELSCSRPPVADPGARGFLSKLFCAGDTNGRHTRRAVFVNSPPIDSIKRNELR